VNPGSCAWRLCVLLGAAACASAPPPPSPVPALPPESIETSLYLIGDAGAPDSVREPVLLALRQELASRGRHSQRVVIFLGDNAYPKGLPAPDQPGRRTAELNLAAQVESITASGATGYFVPGNHDWAKHGREGWDAIKRQAAFIDSAGNGTVSLHPHGGCPGPDVVDVGIRLRLVLLDTQWWLHRGPKPQDPTSDCPTDAEWEIVDSLRAALTGRGRGPPSVDFGWGAWRVLHLEGPPFSASWGGFVALDPATAAGVPLSVSQAAGLLQSGCPISRLPTPDRRVRPGVRRRPARSLRVGT
jgi:hypothetical protein